MSLLGALQLGSSSLAAQQIGLQVTGNNIANAGTAGYSRQVVQLTPSPSYQAGGQSLGTGVAVQSIDRQVNESLNESLRNANSDQSAAQTLSSYLTQLQSTYGALSGNDLSSQMSNFFNSFSTLANNPSDPGQRSVVIQNGVSLSGYLQSLSGQVTAIGTNVNAQIQAQAVQANSLVQSIASLNQQIATTQGASGNANSLSDQRDQALTQLSQLMNIRTIDTGNGQVNVLVGSTPIVMGSTTRGITTKNVTNPDGTVSTSLAFADNGDTLQVTGGSIGALMNTSANYITPALNMINSIAAGLISTVNTIHSQGQGLAGFTSVTGATQVLDPTAALNAASSTTGIAFPPTNGTFDLNITDASTGQTTTQQITVNLSGQGTQTTLNSLAAGITAAGGGNVSATVNSAGNLVVSSSNPNTTFSFGDDTSGTLAALGINTFFTGSNANNIAVNGVLANNPDYLASGQDNIAGSNANAQALALAGGIAQSSFGGQSLQNYYTKYTGNLAAQAQNASDDVTAQGVIQNTLSNQVQSVSGVSMDEETINLMNYQQAYQGTARYINIINQMMQTVLTLVQ